jgi:hypothetical protein
MMQFTIDDAPRTSPRRPAVRAGVRRIFNGYTVPGLVTVEAWPHRSIDHARQIARRVRRDPAGVLAVCRMFRVPGVIYTRPQSLAACLDPSPFTLHPQSP